LIGLVVLASLLAQPADGTAPSALSFAFEGCSDTDAQEIEDVVRADIAWAPGDPSIVLTLQCQAAGVRLSLLIDDTPGQERFVDLAQTAAEARLRTVALIATELVLVGRSAPPTVRSRRAGADRGPTSPSSGGDDRPSATPRSSPAERPDAVPGRSSVLIAAGAALHAAAPSVALFQLGGRLRGDLFSWGGLAFDLGGLYQRRAVASGTLTAAGGAAALVAETRVRLGGGTLLRGGLGARFLALRVSGATSMADLRPTAAWGAAVEPLARIAGAHEWERAVVEVALEGGWCGPEVIGTVGGASSIGVGVWWGGLSLAAGWRLGRDRDRAAFSSAEDDPRRAHAP